MLSEVQKQQLDEAGYLKLPGFMDAAMLDALRARVEELFASEGDEAGAEFKQEPGTRRLANLVNKGEVFERMIAMPEILECMAYVLGPRFDERGYWVCNSVWMLDDFTTENGAIRMIPGSQAWRRLPPPETYTTQPGEELVTGRGGTVVIMNAHMWHGATDNNTDRPRRAVHAFYTRWDKPQQQYQKSLLSETVLMRLSAEVRAVLALDDKLNDELSAAGSGASGFLK